MGVFAAMLNPIANYSGIFGKRCFTKKAMALINNNPIIVNGVLAYHIGKAKSLAHINLTILMPQLLHRNRARFNNKHGLHFAALLL